MTTEQPNTEPCQHGRFRFPRGSGCPECFPIPEQSKRKESCPSCGEVVPLHNLNCAVYLYEQLQETNAELDRVKTKLEDKSFGRYVGAYNVQQEIIANLRAELAKVKGALAVMNHDWNRLRSAFSIGKAQAEDTPGEYYDGEANAYRWALNYMKEFDEQRKEPT